MRHVGDRGAACPRLFPTVSGDFIGRIRGSDGSEHFVRLISFLPGRPMGELTHHSDELLHDLGRKVGQLDAALADFDHPAAHRDLHWDLAHALREIDRYRALLPEPALRALVDSLATDFERDVVPLLGRLRRSVIQNDANDYNVIVGGSDDGNAGDQQVIGIVDFGDLVYSYTVADPAIAIAYAILDKPDPLAAATHIVRGYHAEYPLTEVELAALFGLVCMRLCVSACMAAHQRRLRPDDPYLAISQAPIRNTLPRLARIDSRAAQRAFREACGFLPAPR
jgi:Ser/Thr protein kinase RdoA (MazF antagonist)